MTRERRTGNGPAHPAPSRSRARCPRAARRSGFDSLIPAACSLFLLLLLLAGPATPAAAQQPTAQEIAESQRRLEQIRRERTQLRTEMERMRTRVHGLSSELENLERQVGVSTRLLTELDTQILQRERQVEENTRELLQAHDQMVERRAILLRRLREIYKRGPLHTPQVLLGAESFSELLNRYRYLFLVARQDRGLMQEIAELESRLAARERLLRRDLSQLQTLQMEKSTEHEELARIEEEQRRALLSARARQRTTEQRIQQLERDEKRLATLIATLERKRREAERRAAAARRSAPASGAPADAPTLSTRDMGSLGWPVDGRVIYRFGRTTQPNGTVLRWNGVGIAATPGTRVRAVRTGTVVLAGPFEGYGPTVVLSHGGGYYSLYLYLREISVREGSVVRAGDEIGGVGGEATPEGPHIEFQIRAPGGQAIDPLPWLRKRSA